MPKRAQYLRVLTAELQRVASHLLWLGTWCMDMGGALGGGATIFLYCIRERELILDLFESLVGARLLYGFYQVGGVRYDIPAGWADQCRETIDLIEQRIGEYEAHARGQPVLPGARAGRGRDLARAGRGRRHRRARCCAARASNFDLRRAEPVLVVRGLRRSRCRSRPPATASRATACGWSEFRESIRIVRQALDGLPEGRSRRGPGVKSVAQVRIPKGEAYARVEGAARRGRLLPDRRRQRQAVSHEVARRVVLQPRGAAAHHSRPQGRRRRRDHGLGRPVFGEVDR